MKGPAEEIERLRQEVGRLSAERDLFIRYIRGKVDELLVLLDCPTMNADALGDTELIGYDPIGTIASSFSKVLSNLKDTNERLVRQAAEKKRVEEELRKAEKLESIGVLAGGIAHDFNNLLTAILGNLTIARIHVSGNTEAQESLSKAKRACLRARDLTRKLLVFSRGGAPVRKAVPLTGILSETADACRNGGSARRVFDLPADLPPVEIDEGQIVQAIAHIVANADQSMPEGGTLQIIARAVEIGPENPFSLKRGKYVRVTISDTGAGIPADALPKIFDPFFTTKEGGSGLGLTTAYAILRQHGGAISVDSEEGKGTSVTLHLPVADDSARQGMRPLPAEGSRRVLVMDDEEMVRDVAIGFLGHIGFEAEAVPTGEAAIAAYRSALEAGRPYSLVVMDLTIPGGMGGKDAVARLREIDPNVVAVVSSGYSNDPVMADPAKFGFRGVIAKPYRIEELQGVIDRTLS